MTAYARHQFTHFIMRKKCGRTTTPMQLNDFVGAFELCCLQGDFLANILDVLGRVRTVFCDDFITRAVVANRIAERDVHV